MIIASLYPKHDHALIMFIELCPIKVHDDIVTLRHRRRSPTREQLIYSESLLSSRLLSLFYFTTLLLTTLLLTTLLLYLFSAFSHLA